MIKWKWHRKLNGEGGKRERMSFGRGGRVKEKDSLLEGRQVENWASLNMGDHLHSRGNTFLLYRRGVKDKGE